MPVNMTEIAMVRVIFAICASFDHKRYKILVFIESQPFLQHYYILPLLSILTSQMHSSCTKYSSLFIGLKWIKHKVMCL